jgi:hypothetical protein
MEEAMLSTCDCSRPYAKSGYLVPSFQLFLFSRPRLLFPFRGCIMQCIEQFSFNHRALTERNMFPHAFSPALSYSLSVSLSLSLRRIFLPYLYGRTLFHDG